MKSVDKILNTFSKTLKQLEQCIEFHADEVIRQEGVIKQAQNQIDQSTQEGSRAASVHSKIQSLLN